MASTNALRRVALLASRPATRNFHSSARAFVQVGDSLPNLNVLVEGSPGNKVNLREALTGKGLIIGVPAAFSPSCSNSHIPGYIGHKKLKEAGDVFVVTVNDAFVTKAWGDALDPAGESNIHFLGDPSVEFTKALDLDFDGAAIFGAREASDMCLRLRMARSRKRTSNLTILGLMSLPPKKFLDERQ